MHATDPVLLNSLRLMIRKTYVIFHPNLISSFQEKVEHTNRQLEQNIFSFTYFQLDWGFGNNQGMVGFFQNLHKLGSGNKLKSEEKN